MASFHLFFHFLSIWRQIFCYKVGLGKKDPRLRVYGVSMTHRIAVKPSIEDWLSCLAAALGRMVWSRLYTDTEISGRIIVSKVLQFRDGKADCGLSSQLGF